VAEGILLADSAAAGRAAAVGTGTAQCFSARLPGMRRLMPLRSR
jgi:hypothetical protein